MSTQSKSLLALTVIAAGVLAAERFVTIAGAYPAAGGNALGVTRTDVASGAPVAIDTIGTAVVTAGDAISKGDYLETTITGTAIPLDSGVALAQALADADDGGSVEVLLLLGVSAGVVGPTGATGPTGAMGATGATGATGG